MAISDDDCNDRRDYGGVLPCRKHCDTEQVFTICDDFAGQHHSIDGKNTFIRKIMVCHLWYSIVRDGSAWRESRHALRIRKETKKGPEKLPRNGVELAQRLFHLRVIAHFIAQRMLKKRPFSPLRLGIFYFYDRPAWPLPA